MELLGKIFFIIKLAFFIVVGARYSFWHNFNEYSEDFDNNFEVITALSVSSVVAFDSLFKMYGVKSLSELLMLSAFALLSMVAKAVITLIVTFYCTKLLKNPQPLINWVKTKFKRIIYGIKK